MSSAMRVNNVLPHFSIFSILSSTFALINRSCDLPFLHVEVEGEDFERQKRKNFSSIYIIDKFETFSTSGLI